MQFVVKYFSEIVMRSKPVRRQFVPQLEDNLRAVLCDIRVGSLDPVLSLMSGGFDSP
tara:strand:+ start:15898 stop:16068 length:171 start_codon:yes stop_codon:yes gene_type:complete